MAFGKTRGFGKRKRAQSADAADIEAPSEDEAPEPARPLRLTKDERYGLFARLAWLTCYNGLFAAERLADAGLMNELAAQFASTYTQRAMERDPEGRQAAAHFDRMRETGGFLRRAADVTYVPFSQAVKAAAFLAAMTPGPVWVAERKARRVVCRAFAITLLITMAACRPPPPFETHDCISAFVIDQTYARTGGCGTGSSRYRPVETLDENFERRREERLIYMNGFERALRAFVLSDDARQRLEVWGPYTQSFDCVVPILQPNRMQVVMDDLLQRTVALLAAAAAPGAVPTRAAAAALLARPRHDPGGATYLTWLRPLPWCDTKSYKDMLRIVQWVQLWLGFVPLVLILLGDGQTVLRLRDLKRKHPAQYKHVLVCNDGFHSSAHFHFAVFRIWWPCFLATHAAELGKDKVGPDMKNLEHNAWEHSLQFILPIVVAIFVFLTRHVTEPPPELLFRDPVLYVARVQNASGIAMLQFLRHAGLPALWWHRAARAEDSRTLDDVHALSFHTFRTAHKTSSTQISLMHLLSIYGTHPELRACLREHMFISQRGRVGASVYSGRALEVGNEVQKERNLSSAVLDSLLFTELLQPMMHVYRTWKAAQSDDEPGDVGFRASIVNEVEALVAFYLQHVGTDLVTYTESNVFWHTRQPCNMRGADVKTARPWEWIWLVAEGRSRGRDMSHPENWWTYTLRHIRDHMFFQ